METTFGLTVYFVVVLTIMAIGIPSALAMWRGRRQKARRLADALGFNYESGGPESLGEYRAGLPAPAVGVAGKVAESVGFFFASLKPWRVSGTKDGITIFVYEEVRGGGKQSHTYLITKAFYPKPLSYKLRAAREGFFAKLGKALFNLQDVQVGDPDFDPKVRIVAENPDAAAELFGRQDTAEAFLRLLDACPDAFAEQDCVVRERQNGKLDAAELGAVIDALIDFAKRVKA